MAGTSTPIPWWLSLPLADLFAWNDTIVKIQIEDKSTGGDG